MSEVTPKTKSLVFVHGHNFKPAHAELVPIWCDALRWGIKRDYPDKVALFDAVNKEMAYFGDLSNNLLAGKGLVYDERLDLADRQHACTALKEITKRKKFRRYEYQQLPGKTALKEILADIGSPVLGTLGLEQPTIGRLIPVMAEYWNADSDFGAAVRDRVRKTLIETMNRSDEIAIFAHGMGAIMIYDVLWDASKSLREHKVDLLMTLGCPLGNKTVQKNLMGYDRTGIDKYPSNILVWKNIAAEDDFICHDKTVADDFKEMLKLRLISSIHDYRIYNMAVRYGKSNPHSSVGYLIHPRISKLISDWL